MRTIVVLLACGTAALPEEYVRANAPAMFADFEHEYGRQYTATERDYRQKVFTANMIRAAQLEQEEPLATFGVNKFADMTADEFRVYHSGFVPRARTEPINVEPLAGPEMLANTSGIDWRKHGAVTAVKDQAQCGSCWAFSAIGAIEAAWFMAGNELTSLSEEELVQCDKGGNMGCNGGDMYSAISWVKSHGGVNSEKAYPYTSGKGRTGSCDTSKDKTSVAKITSVASIPHDEAQMLAALRKYGPLSIGVDAGRFQSYRSGVLSNCAAGQVDHGVTLVGYQNSHKAWIVKNSWGASWGESGYIRLQYGSNQCNLKTEVTRAHEKKANSTA